MQRIVRVWWAALICLLVSLAGAEVGAAESAADKTLSPYFFVEGRDEGVDRLPLKATAVDVKVVGVIADVTVRQTYENLGKRPIHARYVFPASTRAAVNGLRMVVGEQVIEAQIREKQKAKQEFEQAKQEGKSATLLEQDRPNVFSMNVANVMPGDTIEVTLRYTELLVPEQGTYEFVYPTVVGPRYSNQPEATAKESDRWVKSPYLTQGQAPTSTFSLKGSVSTGVPVQEIASSSHPLDQTWDEPNFVRFGIQDKEKRGGNRDFILRYRLSGKTIESGLTLYDGGNEKFFLLLAEPPQRVALEQIPPREYVFVVDVSGSMHGFPLETAKHLMRNLAGQLRPVDKVNLLLFSGDSRFWAAKSQPATSENVSSMIAMLDAEQGGGGTELHAALSRALTMSSNEGISRSFVVITDGYIMAEKDVFDLIRQHRGDANTFAFGIGSGVNRYLIEGIAKAGLGLPFVVESTVQAQGVANRFKDYIAQPVLTDVKVKFDGFQAYDVEPGSIPDLLSERPVVVFGKYKGNPSGKITLEGLTGQGKYAKSFDVSAVKARPENKALRYLWARTRISDLSDFASGELSDRDRKAVTELGLRYNLLTQYTSFVAVAPKVRNAGGKGSDVDQPLPLPAGVSNLAVGGGMAGAPEPGLLLLVPLTLFGFIAWDRRRRRIARRELGGVR